MYSYLPSMNPTLRNVVGIATGYGLDVRDSIPCRDKIFFRPYSVETGSEAHPASYPMFTGAFFTEGQVTRALSSPLTSSAEVENCGALPPLPIRLHGMELN
jgi:hypothetical protein